MNAFHHKGYVGVIDTFDDDLGIMSGTVLGIRDVLYFEGETLREVKASFLRVVDSYLQLSHDEGIAPEKPKSGRFNLRVNPKLHRQMESLAAASGKSLNDWIEEHLEADVEEEMGELISA